MKKEVIEIKVVADDAISDVNKLENSFDSLDSSVKKVNKNLDNTEKESKKVATGFEDVTKNGGAIALLDSVTGGLASRVRDTFEATKLFNFSLKGTSKALIATGIGAFVVALGLVVAYWDDIRDAITGANKALEVQNTLIDQNISNLDREYKILEEKEKLLISEGKSVKSVKEEKEKLLKLQLQENENLLANLKTQLLKEKSASKELGFFEMLTIKAKGVLSGEAQANAIASIVAERFAIYDEIDKQIDEATARAFTLQTLLNDINKPTSEDVKKSGNRKEVTPLETLQIGIQKEQELIDTSNAEKEFKDKVTQDNIAKYREQIRQEEEQARQEELQRDRYLQEQKIAFAANAFGAIGDILGKQTAAGKATAAASALINTYQGISNVWAEKAESGLVGAGLIQRIATTGIVAAQGFATVKNILKTRVPNSGGSTGGGVSIGSQPQVQAPKFNIVGDSETNQLANALGSQSKQPVKAYVVSNDVTTQQSLDRQIISNATFG